MKLQDILLVTGLGIGAYFLLSSNKQAESFATTRTRRLSARELRRLQLQQQRQRALALQRQQRGVLSLPAPPPPPPPPLYSPTGLPYGENLATAAPPETPEQRDARLRATGATILSSTPNVVEISRPNITPPEVIAAREQAEAINQQRAQLQLARAQARVSTPLTQTDIASHLQTISGPGYTFGSDMPKVVYPGFVQRPDGLLQWDGNTIPDFLQSAAEAAQMSCSGLSAEDAIHCEIQKTSAIHMMNMLRNRPWVPGVDMTSAMIGHDPYNICMTMMKLPGYSEAQMDQRCREIYGGPQPLSEAAMRQVRDQMQPHPIRTAQEQEQHRQSYQQIAEISARERALEDAADLAYWQANNPSLVAPDIEGGRIPFTPQYYQAMLGDTKTMYAYHVAMARAGNKNAKAWFVGRGSSIDRKRRL